MAIDSAAFRAVLGHYPTGVCIITGMASDNFALGMTVGTFTSVSLEPPLIGFLPDKKSKTWSSIKESGQFCVNILAHDQAALCREFSRPNCDRFAGVAHRASNNGLPILDGVIAWIDCNIYAVQDAGDHDFVLGKVNAMSSERAASPLIFHTGRFGQIDLSELKSAW